MLPPALSEYGIDSLSTMHLKSVKEPHEIFTGLLKFNWLDSLYPKFIILSNFSHFAGT